MTTPKTPAELRQMSADCLARREESFERCDTDGFVSQFCAGKSSALYQTLAEIAENDGTAEFPGLFEVATGRRLAAKVIDTQFGTSWVLSEGEARTFGRKFMPYDGSHVADKYDGQPRSRVQKKAGVVQKLEMAPAAAKLDAPAGSKGFSGLANVFVHTYRTDGGYPGAVTGERL